MIEIIYRNTVEQWIECASFASKKSRDEKKLDRPRVFLTSACAVIFNIIRSNTSFNYIWIIGYNILFLLSSIT